MAPTALTASAVAMNELVGTITSSPGPISRARSASASASVPEETPTATVGLAVGGELALERLDGLSEGERAPLGDCAHRAHQLLEQLGVGEVEPRERDRAPARLHRPARGCGGAQHATLIGALTLVDGAEPSRLSSCLRALRPRWCRP